MPIADGRVFVTMLGRDGVPARLAVVTNQESKESGPLLKPYPEWAWFTKRDGNCDGLTSLYRIRVRHILYI